MRLRNALHAGVAAIAITPFCAAPAPVRAQQNAPVSIGDTDLGGVVTGPNGPEAGVWVIAETTDLPTKMAKIVVTDDQGRYVMPDLPKANYTVWVRGYGLVDSPKVQDRARQDRQPDRGAGARARRRRREYYPPVYWYSMLKIPDKSEFPGTGTSGNGINPTIKTPGRSSCDEFKTDGCFHCHAIGNKATRTHLAGARASSSPATRPGCGASSPARPARTWSRPSSAYRHRARRSRCSATGPTGSPPANCRRRKPPRPQGVERNVVITVWDWSSPKAYLHDEIATDKRNPTVNAYGPLYGATENSTDFVPILDPVKNTATTVKIPVRDPKTPSLATAIRCMAPSPYWGDEKLWDSQTIPHNPMLDEKARVWFAARIRPRQQSRLLQEGLGPSVGEAVPDRHARTARSRCSTRRPASSR